MKSIASLVAFCCLTLLIAPACTTTWKAHEDPAWRVGYPQVQSEPGLSRFMRYGEPVVTPGDPMQVVVPVRYQRRQQSLDIQYRFVFFDDLGRPLNPDAGWRWTQLPAKRPVYLEGTATQAGAADWSLELREAQ